MHDRRATTSPRRAEAPDVRSPEASRAASVSEERPSSPFGRSPNQGKTDAAKRRRVGAGRDAAYLVGELRERSLAASAVLLNRAVGTAPAWVTELEPSIAAEPELGAALTAYRNEYSARAGQTERALGELGGMVDRKTPRLALPSLRTSDPREILIALAGELAGSALVRG